MRIRFRLGAVAPMIANTPVQAATSCVCFI